MTEYKEYEIDEREQVNETMSRMTIREDDVKKFKSFKYLPAFVQKNESFEEKVKHRIGCG